MFSRRGSGRSIRCLHGYFHITYTHIGSISGCNRPSRLTSGHLEPRTHKVLPLELTMQKLISRRLCARLLSTLICSILIVLHPFSRFGGEYAFLALAVKELVFSPDHSLAHQIEKTVLHFFLGGLVGIGCSMFAKYIASLFSPQSALARVIPALFLILICFVGETLCEVSFVA